MLLVLASAGFARAGTITVTESLTASGTLNGVSFTNSLVIFTWTADTATITPKHSGGWTLDPASSTGLLIGSTNVTVTWCPCAVFAYDDGTDTPEVGVTRYTTLAGGGQTILDVRNAAFAGDTLTTSIGPISDTVNLDANDTITTSGGDLRFTSSTGNVTYTQTVSTPEPAAIFLMGFGLLGLAAITRYRIAAQHAAQQGD